VVSRSLVLGTITVAARYTLKAINSNAYVVIDTMSVEHYEKVKIPNYIYITPQVNETPKGADSKGGFSLNQTQPIVSW